VSIFFEPKPASDPSERLKLKPTAVAATIGVVVGAVVGTAYLGGAMAKATTVRSHALKLDAVAAAGFTDEAMAAAAGGLDASALAIAQRHDPYTVAGSTRRDRQAELISGRLEALPRGGTALRQPQIGGVHPVASPFRLANALDASRDLECLTQAVYYEARGEGRDGMRAVAQVVLNRARHPAFPKTVCGVVFQGAGRRTGCQFSFTCDGSMRGRVDRGAWNRASQIATEALSGRVYAQVGTATHFHTTAVAPSWRGSLVRVGQVGDHIFYRFGGGRGSSRAFAYQPGPSAPAEAEPRLIQAGLDPITPVREAGGIAYDLLVARDAPARPQATPTQTTPAQPIQPAPATAAPAKAAEPRPVTAAPAAPPATSSAATASSET
jgi:spore germination cell wall hydrolase CwlJ-like protein